MTGVGTLLLQLLTERLSNFGSLKVFKSDLQSAINNIINDQESQFC